MARLNIDDPFWMDVMKVASKVGDVDKAIGQSLRFFKLAQERFKSGRIITETEFKKEGFSEALFDVFAERVEGGIMAIGAEKHFTWLKNRAEAGQKGGIKSGEARRSESNNLERSKTKQNEANASKPKPLPLTLPLNKEDNIKLSNPPKGSTELNRKIWQAYSDAYRRRYPGVEPVRNLTVNSQISSLGKRLGEEAVDVIVFYVANNNSFYAKNCHPVSLCLKDAESLRTQWKMGRAITEADVKNYERNQRMRTLVNDIESGDV